MLLGLGIGAGAGALAGIASIKAPTNNAFTNTLPGQAGESGGLVSQVISNSNKIIENATKPYTKSNLQLGQQMHTAYKAGMADNLTTFKEFTGIKGIRPDFVDFNTKTIYELKPYNPRGIQQGWNQLYKYQNILEQYYGGSWKVVLEFFKIYLNGKEGISKSFKRSTYANRI